ncbi:MAG: alpha-galactosidase [Clostridia bacterium]|nr:alpha-galactosidase [Clostridia bacterium]
MKRNYQNLKADALYADMIVNTEKIPFSFIYDHIKYTGFPTDIFTPVSQNTARIGDKETTTLVFALDVLSVTAVITHYFSHGATELTVWFENVSKENSRVIEELCFESRFHGEKPVLRGILGDIGNQYKPYVRDLSVENVNFVSDSGRPTHGNFPYFNLEYGNGGTMLAIGWAGTWTADFSAYGEETVYTAKCINGIQTYLKSAEKIRTALFVMASYTVRDEYYATNYWRDWFIAYNLPKADAKGNPLLPFSTCNLASDTGIPNSDGSISERHFTWRRSLEKMIAEDCKVDFRWFDAGWYIAPDLSSPLEAWWSTVGTWVLDPMKWPDKTFLESTDFARANGMKTLMWFEPERITDPDNMVKNFGYKKEWAIHPEGARIITNNIGDPECFAYTTERICKTLRENKVEMYREDNNCNPAPLWRYLDAREGEGRRGITESKFIIGHYQMWDAFIDCTTSYGGCAFVDSCASGGGRNDLESMRRGVPILRSDSDRTSIALRLSMTTSFNQWIPFCGANTKEKAEQLAIDGISDVYTWRASYLPILNVDSRFIFDETQNFDILRFGLREWKKVNPYLLKDFYVLTPWHTEKENDGFTAYTFVDPETQKGVLLAFRQERTEADRLTLSIPFAKSLILTDEDTGEKIIIKDGEFSVVFNTPREAKLFWIAYDETMIS